MQERPRELRTGWAVWALMAVQVALLGGGWGCVAEIPGMGDQLAHTCITDSDCDAGGAACNAAGFCEMGLGRTVGSECTRNAACASGFCVPRSATSQACRAAASLVGGACNEDSDCGGGSFCTLADGDGQSGLVGLCGGVGALCSSAAECSGSACGSGVCGGVGAACSTASQCVTMCRLGVCGESASCSDGVLNGDETAIDCGGKCGCPSGIPESGPCDCSLPAVLWRDCAQIKSNTGASLTGVYVIDPDGVGEMAAFPAYCDMVTDGGGWTLVLNYLHQGSTHPPLAVRSADLPLQGSTTLGFDESADPSLWGHAGNALLSSLADATQLRFYGVTGAHSRVVHFKTALPACMEYFKTGVGSCFGLPMSFTPLSGHTAFLPAQADGFGEAQGDAAATAWPWRREQTYYWSIAAAGSRWEVDDAHDSYNQNTWHQIWVRPPVLLAKARFWLDASDTHTLFQDVEGAAPVSENGQAVRLWKDKSANHYHARLASTAARPPTLALEATHGRAALSFNTSQMDAVVQGPTLFGPDGTTFTLFVVTKNNSVGGVANGAALLRSDAVGDTSGAACANALNVVAPWRDAAQTLFFDAPYCPPSGGTRVRVACPALDTYSLYTLVRTAARSAQVYHNGSLKIEAGEDVVVDATNPYLARADITLAIGPLEFTGQMLEILIFNTVLSEADRKSVEQYLALKWGLTQQP